MSTAIVPLSAASSSLPEQGPYVELRKAVLNGVAAATRRRTTHWPWMNCQPSAWNGSWGFLEHSSWNFRAAMLERELNPSTINVKLFAIRKLVDEAKRAGIIDAEEASQMSDLPNVAQRGTRQGNWLTKEQARELLAVPDRSTIKGLRDYAILSLLVGCALRRRELESLTVEDIQMRENRWVIADLRGKGGRIRTVAVPVWVKQAINASQAAAKIEGGPLLRSLNKVG